MTTSRDTLAQWRQQFDARWSAMAPRERRMVQVMAWALVLVLVVMVGLRPAWRSLNETPAQLQAIEAQLEQMRRWAQETQQLRQRPPVPPIQAEAALRAANAKFTRRFGRIEDWLAESGKHPADSDLAEMDALWNRAKAEEKATKRGD